MTNIFLVTVDDLRADHVGYIDQSKNFTPHIDAFAEDNISFMNALATGPRTTLSFPSILFSLYASEYFSQRRYRHTQSISSFLKQHGYQTATFNSNPHFRLWGFSKGFDFFEDFLDETRTERDKPFERLKKRFVNIAGNDSFLVKSLQRLVAHVSTDIALPYADASLMNRRAIEWLDSRPDPPFFCWVHYMDPHYPFSPPNQYIHADIGRDEIPKINRFHKRAENHEATIPGHIVEKLKELYAGEVRYLDACIGNFFEKLKQRGLFDDSLIVFTADHGELFGDHGFFGHRYDVLYQKQLHVPLIVKTPDSVETMVKNPVSLIDVPHTLVTAAGFNSPFRGIHLWKGNREYVMSEGFKRPSLPSESEQSERGSVSEMVISCQKDTWKLIDDGVHDRKELYNLKDDPAESRNVYGDEDEIVAHLSRQISSHRAKFMPNEKRILSEKIRVLKKSGRI